MACPNQLGSSMSTISSLYTVLTEFSVSISASEDPTGFLDAARQHILAKLQPIGESAVTAFVETASSNIFWLAYTFAHVKLCSGSPSVARNLEIDVATWSKDDSLTQLINYQSMRSKLSDYLNLCNGLSHNCTSADDMEILTRLDMTIVAVQILLVIKDSDHKASFLALRDNRAQALLDLMQILLDLFRSDVRLRRPLVQALVKLSKSACLYPESLILRDVQKLGEYAIEGGAFGDVWHGELKGEKVAIKIQRVFALSEGDKFLKAFSHEAVLWRQLCHPNLLPFYGVWHCDLERSRICLVSPWMENGNITQYLRQNPTANRVSLLCDVARGLEYLHSQEPCVIHGDLKGPNILIMSSGQPCIADFGVSKLVYDFTKLTSMTGGGTLRYQAPEVFDDSSKGDTPARDIYAFGCVCYEIFVGKPPFHDLGNMQVIKAVTSGKRSHRPSSLSQFLGPRLDSDMWGLITRCWAQNPVKRPPAQAVVESLLLMGEPVDSTFDSNQKDLAGAVVNVDIRSKRGPLRIYTPAPGLSEPVAAAMAPLFKQNFVQVNSQLEADLVFYQDTSDGAEDEFVIERSDKYGNYTRRFKRNIERLPGIFDAITRFNDYLWSDHSSGDFLKGQIKLEMYRLIDSITPDISSRISLSDGEVQIEEDTNAKYGIAIFNNSKYDLFPYVFYFDPSTYEIDAWYTPTPETPASLPSIQNGRPGMRTLGFGSGWDHAFEFFVPKGRTSDTGFLKFVVLSEYEDRSGMEQPCPFEGKQRAARVVEFNSKSEDQIRDVWVVPITVFCGSKN